MMLQKQRQSEQQRDLQKSNKSQLSIQDLSITSQRNEESDEEICEGQLFKYKLRNTEQFSQYYPDVFEQHPNSLIVKLSNFIKSFRRHTVAKLLHYELNCALILQQISFKLSKIKKYYENDQPLSNSFRLLEYYLKLHSITNLCKLAQMVKILINKKQVSQEWIIKKKAAFIELKTNHKIHIQLRDGMELLLAIDNFTFITVNTCSQLKYTKQYLPQNLSNINELLIDNLPVPLQVMIKLIPKPQNIILPKIQQNFQDQKLQRLFHKFTKAYFNKLYKQIIQFYRNNSTDRDLNQLLFFILVAKISGEYLPFKLLELIQKEKDKLETTSKIIKTQNLQEFIIKSNGYFRAQLPKLHLLIKNRGFMKLLSFLHQSDFKDIQEQINWCFDSNNNLNNDI